MAGVGIYLRQAREQLGYSLEEMNRITNIHTEYLYALENDQFDRLPSPFYARAFLRTYAKCLGLEVQPLLDLYEKLTRTAAPMSEHRSAFTAGRRYDTAGQRLMLPERTEQTGQHYLPAQSRNAVRGRRVSASELESTGRQTPVAAHTQKHVPVSNPFPNLPKPDLSAQTLSPRRVALEAKQGLANEEAKRLGRKGKKFPAIAAAVGALILAGGVYYFAFGNETNQTSESEPQQISEIDTSVNADGQKTPILEQGETPEREYDGQLYTISNVDKLEVVLKVKEGESRLFYAPTPNDPFKELTLRTGQVLKLDTAGKDHIWFRLSVPSNVDISVNGQQISTEAQDTEKSYRVQLKK
ncbi:helix-turn-helix domain-containing protein [Lihuaxuella thermophila]|uniref:Protein RodZ, contains Xre-like HTH and DUF4115 domains n=1 Tax=Lihuaxuella thermophila TaxID=1173111 RepID=A0A1H8GJ33_9BACL|nr:helix-turn-helix domain-containing protein [Lihuaxuella thermophila]SEN43973.1 protein RodZ, contains Xre-like HTH and DUF4115 domains [Lihuaxuella thermophila]